ncbi:MAG TPA: hypothetical protein VMZ52_07775 [Bryobacteraceae bacterium]|nr:hypothetical protein [Bryobacteraceae bacterium]
MKPRPALAAWWLGLCILCLAIYWDGLRSWFLQDDFAWLKLRLLLHKPGDIWNVLFTPMAQGSIRPLSERAFFLLFEFLFGLNALPFRVWVFLTQFVNLALVGWLAWKLTGSQAGGVWAPLLWLVNPALATPMSWTSSYNQILCAFFLLTSLSLLVRYVETGEIRYYAWQWVTFLLGFGALELNVVYPALAGLYTLVCARRYFKMTLPMFAVSGAYAAIHRQFTIPQTAGPYAMHWDASMFSTLAAYARLVTGVSRMDDVEWRHIALAPAILFLAVLLGFALWRLWRRDWIVLVFLGLFVIVLAPLLPLRDHVAEYYLTIPSIGIAMLAAWGLTQAWRSGFAWKTVAVVLAGTYFYQATAATRADTRSYFEQSRLIRTIVRGVVRARELHPNHLILLKGVRSRAFWAGFVDRPFILLGISDVYLVPGSEEDIEKHPDIGDPAEFSAAPGPALQALAEHRAVVYEVLPDRLRNVTALYRELGPQQWNGNLARMVDAGSPSVANQFGPGWYAIEGTFRWMAPRSETRLAGPSDAGQRVFLKGSAPEQLWRQGVKLQVSLEGIHIGDVNIRSGEFDWSAGVPPQLVGRPEVTLTLQSDRAFRPPGDGRDLSVAFGSLAIR